jgi:inositol phosphorylceramide synthase catalytic subunit
MAQPFLFKIFLVTVYTLGLLIPFTGQFVLPATPIFSWLLLFYSSQFIPRDYRPHIWVSVLPTLESVLYGANISDILTRFTNPVLDIVAWIPYGVLHFVIPFVVAAFLFVFSPPGAVKFWGAAFGYVNIVGVMIQILFPCAPPCTFSLHYLPHCFCY